MNSEYYEYDDNEEIIEENYHSNLFEPEDITSKNEFESHTLSNENMILQNYSNSQIGIVHGLVSYYSSIFTDPSKFIEESKEVNSNLQEANITAKEKEFVDQKLSSILPKKQKKQRVNRKQRSYTDNFNQTVPKKKKSKAENIIRISDILHSNQNPNQGVNLEKKQIFKISKLNKQYKAPSLENSPKKGENSCLDNELELTPEKIQYCNVEE